MEWKIKKARRVVKALIQLTLEIGTLLTVLKMIITSLEIPIDQRGVIPGG